MNRTYEPLTNEHLAILQELALEEFERMLTDVRKGKYEVYRDKLISICLCEDAGQHFVETQKLARFDHEVQISIDEIEEKSLQVEGKIVLNGIHSIDIWFFFAEDGQVKLPNRGYMSKSLSCELDGLDELEIDFPKQIICRLKDKGRKHPKELVVDYIKKSKSEEAVYLKKRSVVGLYPTEEMGKIYWAVTRTKKG